MKTLPINGRVAIIDDQINQARPIMQELSKRKIPFAYYDGNPENLPTQEEDNNLRVLFLDINLIDNAVHPVKTLYPVVFANVDRIVSAKNFPYILICWSRNRDEYKEIIEKLYNDLPNKKPIASIQMIKSDFFSLDGEKTENYDQNIEGLFKQIADALTTHVTFNNLLMWENHIHKAIDNALSESLSIIENDWDASANWIFTKWSFASAGKNYNSYTPLEKAKAAYHTLNHFLYENIENEIERGIVSNIRFEEDKSDRDFSLAKFNEKLLFSFVSTKAKEAGRIVITPEDYSEFKDMLSFAITGEDEELKEILRVIESIDEKKKAKNNYYKIVRGKIRNDWDIFKLVINPVCDFAQNKVKRNRVIPGIFIKKQYRSLINNNTDSLYVSPIFYYTRKQSEYFFILDFRYFTSEKDDEGESSVKLKQQVLSEILSKLSRHINRQGLLFVED
jgi:hypothetical protein